MGMWSLRRRTEQVVGAELIWLHGEIDLSNAHEVREHLTNLGTNGRHLVVDLSGVTFLDMTGVRLLETLSEFCGTRGVRLLLISLPTPVRRVLHVAQFQPSVPVLESWAAAASHLRTLAPGGH
jgi:anti-sigma B factor antagonist